MKTLYNIIIIIIIVWWWHTISHYVSLNHLYFLDLHSGWSVWRSSASPDKNTNNNDNDNDTNEETGDTNPKYLPVRTPAANDARLCVHWKKKMLLFVKLLLSCLVIYILIALLLCNEHTNTVWIINKWHVLWVWHLTRLCNMVQNITNRVLITA